jgi:predicted nuclease of predicted toxin-antitoxin system
MRLLLDESVPATLRHYLPGHSVKTVSEKGWVGMKNGALLSRAAAEFDALITVDKNLQYQQNLKTLPLTVVVLDTHSNALNGLLPIVGNLMSALANVSPCSIVRVTA